MSKAKCHARHVIVGPYGVAGFTCDDCMEEFCENCLGDADYATDTGPTTVCKPCYEARIALEATA